MPRSSDTRLLGPQALEASARADATSETETGMGRATFAGPAIAMAAMIAAILCTEAAGIGVRDPDHVAGRRLGIVLAVVAVLIVVDVTARAVRRAGTMRPGTDLFGDVWRERWTRQRCMAVGVALISFYISYLAYRNLKSVVPLLRPGDLFDSQLAALDRVLFVGNDPAVLMHSVLGTGLSAQLMSGTYMLFFLFIPGTLAAALVFSADLRAGLFYVTAQSLNWLFGAASYFLVPALGPVYADPATFAGLPSTTVSGLQELLLQQRGTFLSNPAGGTAQSIAAFSSLHVSIFFTGVLAAHLLGLRRWVVAGAWILLGLTVASTIYLGWHYVIDDLGGLVLAAMAVVVAQAMTGVKLRPFRLRRVRIGGAL